MFPLNLLNTNGQALDILDSAFQLNENTVKEWQTLWDLTVLDSTHSYLWIAMVSLGLTIATLGVIWLALAQGVDTIKKQDWQELLKLLVWPFVIAFFLSQNGWLLAQSIQIYKVIGSKLTQNILQISYGGLSLQAAMKEFAISNSAKQQLEDIARECNQYQGPQLADCFSRNQETIERIVEEAEKASGQPNAALRALAQSLITAAGLTAGTFYPPLGIAIIGTQAVVNLKNNGGNMAITVVRGILFAIQWAVVNILEIALLLTALFAPIALGLSVLPMENKPILAWITSFTAIIALQLGYNLIMGLTSIVAIKSGGQLNADIGFMILIAIFSPWLALTLSKGGGIAIYQGLSQKAGNALSLAASGVKKLAKI